MRRFVIEMTEDQLMDLQHDIRSYVEANEPKAGPLDDAAYVESGLSFNVESVRELV